MRLGSVGVWGRYLREADPAEIVDAAAELEELGFGTIWVPGGVEPNEAVFGDVERLLAATHTTAVATGIVNMWLHEPCALAASYQALDDAHPGRFLLGVGISHRSLLDRVSPGRYYDRPFAAMQQYLDELAAQRRPVPPTRMVIAALGPKMLELAKARTAGSHPYLVPADHTRFARAKLGSEALLATCIPVILDSDATRARELGRAFLASPYSTLPNYRNAWLRHGFSEADLAGRGSDRLIDGLIAWGDVDSVASRIREHQAAGADHVCVHVVSRDRARLPRAEWRRLASVLQ